MKRKICFVIVNRANYGRVKYLMKRINQSNKFILQVVLMSSAVLKKYGQLDQVIKKDGFKINSSFFTHVEGENLFTMTKSTALGLLELSASFKKLKPDIVFTIGDRYETLATTIAASYSNIFLCHLQGGELSGSIDESVRHAVTKFSNLHLVATKRSKKIVEQMGENPKMVFNVGCPSIDIIKRINFKQKLDLLKYKGGIGSLVDIEKPYYVFLIHPNTKKYFDNIRLINEMLLLAKNLNDQIIWLWPNNDAGADIITKKIRSFREKNKKLKINFYTNMVTEDYLKIIKNCKCLIGNSSSGIRESSFLKVPVVNVGDRQKYRERGDNIEDQIIDHKKIIKSIKKIINKKIKINKIYGDGNSSKKIIQILKDTSLDISKKFQLKT